MTPIIRDAVRAGCNSMPNTWDPTMTCVYPDCACDYRTALETAARHAADAVKASALFIAVAGQENPQFIPEDIAAIPTGDETP